MGVTVVLLLPVAIIAAVGASSGGGSEAPAEAVDEAVEPGVQVFPAPVLAPVAAGGALGPVTTITGTEVDVRLYHCGFEPIEALGRVWIVEPAPFDETTVPDDFAGTGVLTATDDGTATYIDDGGAVVELTERPPDHQPPPCD